MPEDKQIRVAPVRGGVQIASTWRIWTQGNEFYAATRSVATISKISFHNNFNWQWRSGREVQRLARPILAAPGWFEAARIAFLVDPDVLVPKDQEDSRTRLIETPGGHKLSVIIWVSERSAIPFPRTTAGGQPLLKATLRDGRRLFVAANSLPFKEVDRELIAEFRAKLRIEYSERPSEDATYGEAWYSDCSPVTGNKIAIIPVGYDSVQQESERAPEPMRRDSESQANPRTQP